MEGENKREEEGYGHTVGFFQSSLYLSANGRVTLHYHGWEKVLS